MGLCQLHGTRFMFLCNFPISHQPAMVYHTWSTSPKALGSSERRKKFSTWARKCRLKGMWLANLLESFFSPHIIHTYPLHVAIWPWLYWMLTLQQRCFFSRLQGLPWPHATEWQKDLTSASAVLPTEMDTRCYFQNPWFGSPTSEVFCGLWRLKLDIS